MRFGRFGVSRCRNGGPRSPKSTPRPAPGFSLHSRTLGGAREAPRRVLGPSPARPTVRLGFQVVPGGFWRVSEPENSSLAPKNWSPVGSRIFFALLDVRGSQGSTWGGSGALPGPSHGGAGFSGRPWRVLEGFGAGKLDSGTEKLVPGRFPNFLCTPRRPGVAGEHSGWVWGPPRRVPRWGWVFDWVLVGLSGFAELKIEVPARKKRFSD